jgi:hypothetical protein
MKFTLAIAAAALAFGLASPSFAAAPFGASYPGSHGGGFFPHKPKPAQWELVGQRQISFRGDRENIPVVGRDRHSQVMLCVYNQSIRLNDFDVKFKNGGAQDLQVRSVIGAGQCTRAIDLKGHKRDIRAVTLAAKAIGFRPFGRGATVKVFAR